MGEPLCKSMCLVYEKSCSGKMSIKKINRSTLLPSYVGSHLAVSLDVSNLYNVSVTKIAHCFCNILKILLV